MSEATRGARAGTGVLLAALVAGLGFGGAFGLPALMLPVLAAVAGVGIVDALTGWRRSPALDLLRAPLGLVVGGGAALLAYLATGSVLGEVLRGAASGWMRTLESTLPARPDPELTAFVPLLALIAAVLGVEWLRRGLLPLATLLPALSILVLAQLFVASDGGLLVGCAVGFAVAAALVLSGGRRATGLRAVVEATSVVVPVLLVAALGAWVLTTTGPATADAWSLHDRFELAEVPSSAVSPLDELGGRLGDPSRAVFTVRTDAAVDRWPVAVLDGFDGADWTSSARYRPLGTELTGDPAVAVPLRTAVADVVLDPTMTSPWLPTRFRVHSVEGLDPAVDPATGVLLLTSPRPGAAYRLTWREPVPEPGRLAGAAVDLTASGVRPGSHLVGLDALAEQAAGGPPGTGVIPTFDTALRIEQFFRDTYRLSPPERPVTGNGTRQLQLFLDETRTGTSEQFAAAYVLVAARAGLPVRLVVGYRNPGLADADGRVVVHNSDVHAWPEVAVAGVGWVALDPTGDATSNPAGGNDLAEAIDDARQDLPPDAGIPEPQPAPATPTPAAATPIAGGGPDLWRYALVIGLVVLGVAVLAVLSVPLLKALRRVRRRQAPGRAAVLGAWLDTRDRLRDHGVPAPAGHTVRDLAEPAIGVLGGPSDQLERLARCVDTALWSGAAPPAQLADEAWDAAAQVRRSLAQRPVPDRVRAAVRLNSLTGPRS